MNLYFWLIEIIFGLGFFIIFIIFPKLYKSSKNNLCKKCSHLCHKFRDYCHIHKETNRLLDNCEHCIHPPHFESCNYNNQSFDLKKSSNKIRNTDICECVITNSLYCFCNECFCGNCHIELDDKLLIQSSILGLILFILFSFICIFIYNN